jgi:mitochondrial fission protein ELM1
MVITPQIETFDAEGSFPPDAVCWIISDDKAGNLAQCTGVSDALGLRTIVKTVNPSGLARFLAPYGPVARSERFGEAESPFAPPWPALAIACGRLATPYIRALRRRSGVATYTVILLDPKTGQNTADLFWVPEHDRRRGPNVITSLTSPHRFSPRRLADLRTESPAPIAALARPRITVLIGGPNGDYTYAADDTSRLLAVLAGLAEQNVSLMVTCSRRTPADLARAVEAATARAGRVWFDGEGDNPYPHFLANADAFLVTADSVNMVGEACATGVPVHVFFPSGGSSKFARFHDGLRQHGATRPIVNATDITETWTYQPLYSATGIAAEIKRRVLRRRAVLGNMM